MDPPIKGGSEPRQKTWPITTAEARRRPRPSTTAETPGSVQRWPPPPRGHNRRRQPAHALKI